MVANSVNSTETSYFDRLEGKLETITRQSIVHYENLQNYVKDMSSESWSMIGYVGLFVTLACIVLIFAKQLEWIEAKPNQWLVVIRNGNMRKAGVGIKTVKFFIDTIVTFPCKVETVNFAAKNVTIQMQGILINGFVFWTVYREEDGPFRYYKYMRKINPNTTVQAMCESALRSIISNSTIDQVIKNRNQIRKKIGDQLKGQLKGWGIWLESIEITGVKICSKNLFEDLQAEFRQQTKYKARLAEIMGHEKMVENQQSSDNRMFEKQQLNETKRIIHSFNEDFKRITQEAEYTEKKIGLETVQIEQNREFQLKKIQLEKEKEIKLLQNNQKIARKELDFNLQTTRSKIINDKQHNETTLKKYKIDAAERIYNSIEIDQVKINKFDSGSLLELLPSFKTD